MDIEGISKYHNKYTGFFTEDECSFICDIIQRDKDLIPTDEYNGSGYTGLTSSFTLYNWLYHPDIQTLNIPQRLSKLKEFNSDYLLMQCWCNELETDKGLQIHAHGNPSRAELFYNCNIFLGGDYTETWYEDIGNIQNEVGDLHIFTSDLEHEVYPNPTDKPRYSMAIDIHRSYYHCRGLFNTARFYIYPTRLADYKTSSY